MIDAKIVADSSANMAVAGGCVASVPLKIITDEKEYIDDANLNTAAMVWDLQTYTGKSSTACPAPQDWLDAFEDAPYVFCITITSGLSGSYNAACLAKQLYESEHQGKRVYVFDTLSAGPEITLIIEKIADCVKSGLPFEEVCTTVTEYMKKTGLVFMLRSLKTFANNGRVSPIVAKLVGIAGICIVGKASDAGTLEPIHKCKGEKRALETLVKNLEKEGFRSGKISIGHCQNEEAAEKVKDIITKTFENVQIEIHKFRGLCSFYAEKGGLLIGFEKA